MKVYLFLLIRNQHHLYQDLSLQNNSVHTDFRQVDLYTYKGQLFFKYGSDYFRINADNRTSHADVFIDELPSTIETKVGPMGRLEVVKVN